MENDNVFHFLKKVVWSSCNILRLLQGPKALVNLPLALPLLVSTWSHNLYANDTTLDLSN